MKTSRPEKKLSCAHVDSNSTFPYKHIGAAAENGYTVTMAKKDNESLTGALQKQHNGQETLQVSRGRPGVSSKSAPAGVTPVALRAPYVTPAELNNVILENDT
jgi:hypothetical protein